MTGHRVKGVGMTGKGGEGVRSVVYIVVGDGAARCAIGDDGLPWHLSARQWVGRRIVVRYREGLGGFPAVLLPGGREVRVVRQGSAAYWSMIFEQWELLEVGHGLPAM